jgi:tetratricopeptide (TPR) repeat protein
MVKTRLFPLLVREFPHFCDSIQSLVVDNAYLFKYTPETGRRTGIHTDSGCLSFTISLGGDYEGGGTWMEGGLSTVQMQQGHVTVRPGGIRHCGQAVTRGTRYIIGGFCMHRNKVEITRMLIGLGAELAERGEYDEAQRVLEAAILHNPHFDGAYTHLASVYQKLNRPDKSQQVLEYCLHHVNPLNGEVAFSLGMQYYQQDDYERARNCLLNVCLAVDDSDADAMLTMAQICSRERKSEEEKQWYHRILSTPGVSNTIAASAYSHLGAQYEGNDEEIFYYRKALELLPTNVPVRYSLGCALAAKSDWKAAAECFRFVAENVDDEYENEDGSNLKLLALKNLYVMAVRHVQQEFLEQQPSPDVIMQAIQDMMGADNYRQLAAAKAVSGNA